MSVRAGEARQQRLEGGQQHHEERAALRRGQFPERAHASPRERCARPIRRWRRPVRTRPSAVAPGSSSSGGAPASASRQYASCWPEPAVRRARPAARARSPRTAAGSGGRLRGTAPAGGVVGRGQFPGEHGEGPAVGDEVVNDDQQPVILRAILRAASTRTSGPAARSKGCVTQCAASVAGSPAAMHLDRNPQRRGDHLARHAGALDEHRAQHFVAGNDRVDGGLERAPVAAGRAGGAASAGDRPPCPAAAVRGTTGAAASGTAARARRRPGRGAPGNAGGDDDCPVPHGARAPPPGPRGVGASNIIRSGISARSASRSRATSRVASSEWPPARKKSVSTPTRRVASTSREEPADGRLERRRRSGFSRDRGIASRLGGSRLKPLLRRPSAARSTLPFGVSGNDGSVTKPAGTMCSGRTRRRRLLPVVPRLPPRPPARPTRPGAARQPPAPAGPPRRPRRRAAPRWRPRSRRARCGSPAA